MSVWMVRGGRSGEWESIAIEQNMAVIGWEEISDLSPVRSKEEIFKLCQEAYPDSPEMRLHNWASQMWTFRGKIKEGDLVVLPLKTKHAIAIGEVKGPYKYRTDLGERGLHTRSVKWIRTDIPRTDFDQDILYSFGAAMTICKIQRNDAEKRIKEFLKSGKFGSPIEKRDRVSGTTEQEQVHIEELAQDQILGVIKRKFRGHDFARLIDGILKAEGYQTRLSPPGPDGGVDILAGRGSFGFDSPRLCVQVKSSQSPIDVSVFRELLGVLQAQNAESGLLVSWGGFKDSVVREARTNYFQVRLWDSGAVLKALFRNYEQLPEDLQAELPLMQVWTLVQEKE